MYSNSTGVALPNMETATFNLDLSASTSSTTPLNEAKGPSATLTVSPISKDIVETIKKKKILKKMEEKPSDFIADVQGDFVPD